MLLLDESRPIAFREDTLTVRTLAGDRDLRASYRLRHQVFAQRLHWVEPSCDGIEVDAYDAFATSIGLFDEDEKLRGVFRMVRSPHPFMLEKEFRLCLLEGCDIRKADDTAEITRLALDPTLRDKGLSIRFMQVLFKGVYQWSLQNEVTYLYLVVERRFLRVLRGMGFSCEAISPAVSLPPGEALSIAVILDWSQFFETCPMRQPLFFQWMNTVDGSTSFEKSGFFGCVWRSKGWVTVSASGRQGRKHLRGSLRETGPGHGSESFIRWEAICVLGPLPLPECGSWHQAS